MKQCTKNKCKRHPKYSAINKPRAMCFDCWKIWLEKNQLEEITAKDLIKILSCIQKEL